MNPQARLTSTGPPPRRGDGLIRAWWALFLAGGVLALLASSQGDGVDAALRGSNFAISSTVADIVGGVLAIVVVRRITAAYHRVQFAPTRF